MRKFDEFDNQVLTIKYVEFKNNDALYAVPIENFINATQDRVLNEDDKDAFELIQRMQQVHPFPEDVESLLKAIDDAHQFVHEHTMQYDTHDYRLWYSDFMIRCGIGIPLKQLEQWISSTYPYMSICTLYMFECSMSGLILAKCPYGCVINNANDIETIDERTKNQRRRRYLSAFSEKYYVSEYMLDS